MITLPVKVLHAFQLHVPCIVLNDMGMSTGSLQTCRRDQCNVIVRRYDIGYSVHDCGVAMLVSDFQSDF